MRSHRCFLSAALRPFAATAIVLVALTGCSSPRTESVPEPATDAHGYMESAEELPEARLSLVSGSSNGMLSIIDLVTEEESVLLESTDSDVLGLSGDGRFLFRTERSAGETAVEVVDSGVWTVKHGDHFHYYRAEPRSIGSVTGAGPVVVHTADRRTAITFPESGEVVVVAHDDLEEGVIGEPHRVSITPHVGALAIPFGGALLVTAPDAAGNPSTVEALGPDSAPSASVPCAEASSANLTRVGVVFTCTTGAILATAADGGVHFEDIPYPAGSHAPAVTSLQGRTDRPAVAGPAGGAGAWRLDSRAREWVFLPSGTPLLAASAVSDDANLTIAVDTTGRIVVLDATGTDLAMTEPVLAESVADPEAAGQVRLIVDAHRAYVSDPAQHRVLEIDYRDNARIARTFSVADAALLEQVG